MKVGTGMRVGNPETGLTWAGLAGWFLMFAGIPFGNVVPGLVFLLMDGIIRILKAPGRVGVRWARLGAGTGTGAGPSARTLAGAMSVAIWAFAGLGVVSLLWSLDRAGTAGYSVTLLLVILLACFGARRLVQNQGLLLNLLFPALVASTFGTSIYALVDYFMKGGGRANTLGTQCNGLGTVLILSVALALGYIDHMRGRWLLAKVPLIVISVVALLASMSRGAWIGFAVMGGIYAARTRRALAWVLVVALAATAVIYTTPSLKARFLTIWDMSSNGANHDRLGLWSVTLKMVEAHPLLGVGVGAYRGLYPAFKGLAGGQEGQEDFASAHNIFLQVLAESGIIGLILFIYILYLLGRAGMALTGRGDPLFQGFFAAIGGALVHQLVDATIYWADIGGGFWMIIGLILNYQAALEESDNAPQVPGPAPGENREGRLSRDGDEPVSLSVVITTYKTRELVRRCIESVMKDCERAGVDHEVIVIDNASGDGTVEMIRDGFPQVKLIANDRNVGPARAYNQGIRAASSPFILLLNSDVEVLDGTIGEMIDFLIAHPDVSGVTGKLLNPDLSLQKIRTSIISLARKNYDHIFPVRFVGSGFHMARASAFRDVGHFDENYYFYNEDLDWVERANRKGHKFMFLPGARVIHYSGQGSKQNWPAIQRELYRSNVYYYRKFYGPVITWLAVTCMKAEIWLKLGSLSVKLARARLRSRRGLGVSSGQGREGEVQEARHIELVVENLRRAHEAMVCEYNHGRVLETVDVKRGM